MTEHPAASTAWDGDRGRRRGNVAVIVAVVAAVAVAVAAVAEAVVDQPTVAHDWVGLPSSPVVADTPNDPVAGFDPVYLTYPAGCVSSDDPAAVDQAIAAGLGPLIAFDAIHQIRLGAGRTLWLVQDGFLAPDEGPVLSLRHAQYSNSVAVVFEADGCATVLTRQANRSQRVGFEFGDGDVTVGRFFWPLSGEMVDGNLVVVWAEMVLSPAEPGFLEGIIRHPERTFVAVYDAVTMERLSWAISPEPDPLWGFATVSDGAGYTYLFGNANLLNLAMNGGYDNGPHPATDTYLARMPVGTLADPTWRLEVWDGTGFVRDGARNPSRAGGTSQT